MADCSEGPAGIAKKRQQQQGYAAECAVPTAQKPDSDPSYFHS
jgi:hypothetical protein